MTEWKALATEEDMQKLQARIAELEDLIEIIRDGTYYIKFADGIKNDAIERCAQAAENYRAGTGNSTIFKDEIAAAIRALKDKP